MKTISNDWTKAIRKGMKRGALMAVTILACSIWATYWQAHNHLELSAGQQGSIILPWMLCGILVQAIGKD